MNRGPNLRALALKETENMMGPLLVHVYEVINIHEGITGKIKG